MRYLLGWILLLAWTLAHAHSVSLLPRAALPFKTELQSQARRVFGPDAPVALLAAQVESESSWNPRARSPSGDLGLTQIKPSTARYLARIRPGPGPGSPRSPAWALAAQSYYLWHLQQAIKGAASDCDKWSFSLAAYVGGLGWVNKERALCAKAKGCDPSRWFNHTEKQRARGVRAYRESRHYIRKIFSRERVYASWGPVLACPLLRQGGCGL